MKSITINEDGLYVICDERGVVRTEFLRAGCRLEFAEVGNTHDKDIVELCAEKLAERGHLHAANSLRKMLREGRLLP
jgi:hypothetical protein